MTHVLEGARITIGRGADNTIQIADRSVSAHHAELIAEHGHYRLHDLGSTNMVRINGQPVGDYHLHERCAVLLGNIEAEFSPEAPHDLDAKRTELAPTCAEIDFLKRENQELKSTILDLRRQLDILSDAPLQTREAPETLVPAEAHRRLVEACNALRKENGALKLDAENLQCDIAAILRDRDALRQAWATVQAELAQAESQLANLRSAVPNCATVGEPSLIDAFLGSPRSSVG